MSLTPEGNPASIDVANWANAITGKAKPSSSFDYASRLTETMLLGLVALRVSQAKDSVRRSERADHQRSGRELPADPGLQGRLERLRCSGFS